MTLLYSRLAHVYHLIYPSIFNYEKEFEIYHRRLSSAGCHEILEAGCGTGFLSGRFVNAGYAYTGLDRSAQMLAIACKENPLCRYVQSDMRAMPFRLAFDAVLITGRSFTYMGRNQDVLDCLAAIARALKPGGRLIFDNFNANALFTNFRQEIVSDVEVDGVIYHRVNYNRMNLETGWTWDWHAEYSRVTGGVEEWLGDDDSLLRAFTTDELDLFLSLSGFKTIETFHEGVTFSTTALKV